MGSRKTSRRRSSKKSSRKRSKKASKKESRKSAKQWKTYWTHDNGGRPFQVKISGLNYHITGNQEKEDNEYQWVKRGS